MDSCHIVSLPRVPWQTHAHWSKNTAACSLLIYIEQVHETVPNSLFRHGALIIAMGLSCCVLHLHRPKPVAYHQLDR